VNKSILWVAGVILVATTACAPDEHDVCEHMMKVYANDTDRPKFLDDADSCAESFRTKKTRRGVNSYRREVECILGSDTVYKIRRCMEAENKRQ
jgi:hypothetical protein